MDQLKHCSHDKSNIENEFNTLNNSLNDNDKSNTKNDFNTLNNSLNDKDSSQNYRQYIFIPLFSINVSKIYEICPENIQPFSY